MEQKSLVYVSIAVKEVEEWTQLIQAATARQSKFSGLYNLKYLNTSQNSLLWLWSRCGLRRGIFCFVLFCFHLFCYCQAYQRL